MEIKTSDSYKKEVLEKYKKEKGGEMSMYLLEPTRKNIREACIHLLHKRREKNDDYILNRFFQFKKTEEKIKTIEKFDADKFKPVVNFLIGETNSTNDKNIELISWLIDFKPRPRLEYLKQGKSQQILKPKFDKVSELGSVEIPNNSEIINNGEEVKKEKEKKRRKRLISISISIVFGILLILLPKTSNLFFSTSPNNDITPNQCMTWTKNHYEKVSCTQKFSSKTEPIDPIKLANFKKVKVTMATLFFDENTNQPLIWYYKNKKGEIEYFTAPGLHPINGETLRKITPTIINKYVPIHTNNVNSFFP